ncbi:hypothetical protein KIN20_015477 [Parelaphostrongylus tenuis]|uniref:Uncharacterized protein n=1 Tax=Parelaphostrongylus tenuis TaxID=148309 RepID=A0AAD5QM95_PARTN|nr:hypothetical protein KIN20_015477 [Parelaphostrongylus tenuis]
MQDHRIHGLELISGGGSNRTYSTRSTAVVVSSAHRFITDDHLDEGIIEKTSYTTIILS